MVRSPSSTPSLLIAHGTGRTLDPSMESVRVTWQQAVMSVRGDHSQSKYLEELAPTVEVNSRRPELSSGIENWDQQATQITEAHCTV